MEGLTSKGAYDRVSWKQRPSLQTPQDYPPNDSEFYWLGLGNWVNQVPFKSLYWANWPESSLGVADVSPPSSLLRDVLWRGNVCNSATEIPYWWRKSMFTSNKSGSHGVPNANLLNFTFLLVDFGKVLCSSANELQQNSNASSREDYIPQILTVLLEIHHV